MMSKLILTFFFAINCVVVAPAIRFENFRPDEIWTFIKNIAPRIGAPQLWHTDSDTLLPESTVQDIVNGNKFNGTREINFDGGDYCARDLVRVAFSINETWALSMLDSDGKLPPGILFGNKDWTGSYRECLAVQAPPDPDPLYNQHDTTFGGRYCKMTWSFGKNLAGSIDLCVPDTCNDADFKDVGKLTHVLMSRNVLPQLYETMGLINIQNITCQPKTTKYDAGVTAVLTIIYIFMFLVIVGTFLTVFEALFPVPLIRKKSRSINGMTDNGYSKSNDTETGTSQILAGSPYVSLIQEADHSTIMDRIEKFLKCFCLITNGKKVLNTSDNRDPELRCIHGIRFLSMAWVILGHTYYFCVMTSLVANALDVLNIANTPTFQIIMQGPYSVDSFFVMSGFLLTYLFLREITAKEGKISWLAFYLHRYWRLTPVYMMVVAFDTTITQYLVSGPLQPVNYEEACKETWWWNLLYINNFAPGKMCLGWSWYLSNDMQFYVISPIFLYLLWRLPKAGLGIIFALICGCWICTFCISYHYLAFGIYSTLPTASNYAEWSKQWAIYFDKIYVKPYTRITPYLMGVILAYIIFHLKGRRNFLKQKIQILGWIVSTGMGLFIIFGMYNVQLTRLGTAFYLAFHRPIFSACLIWVMFACITGHGGVVNKILSFPMFIPLGRLTYCAYLFHPIIMTIYYLNMPSKLILTHLQMVVLFFGFLIFSYGAALATTLLFESPAMAMERLGRNKK